MKIVPLSLTAELGQICHPYGVHGPLQLKTLFLSHPEVDDGGHSPGPDLLRCTDAPGVLLVFSSYLSHLVSTYF